MSKKILDFIETGLFGKVSLICVKSLCVFLTLPTRKVNCRTANVTESLKDVCHLPTKENELPSLAFLKIHLHYDSISINRQMQTILQEKMIQAVYIKGTPIVIMLPGVSILRLYSNINDNKLRLLVCYILFHIPNSLITFRFVVK